ncbi:MAG: hypothetical protein Q3994_01820 [Prevotella sp.]|nr:hypothetical protein [Prevotella sp.]
MNSQLIPTATQIVINVQDNAIVKDLRRLLSRMQGVSSVYVKKNYYESREFYQDLDAAERDIADGKGVRVNSLQELDALFS